MKNQAFSPPLAWLEVTLSKQYIKILELKTPVFTIGRSCECDLIIEQQAVSRIHCTLVWRYNRGDSYYQLIDGARSNNKPSTNGVFVGGRRVEEIIERLQHQDVITFGCSTLEITYIEKQDKIERDIDKSTFTQQDEQK